MRPDARAPTWRAWPRSSSGTGNRSRGVDDEQIRARIREVVEFPGSTGMKDSAVTRVLHRNAAEGWALLELVEQLGNVGSEVERAIRAHEAGRADRFESALERALELFDLTAGDPRWRGHRCQEIMRAREEFYSGRPRPRRDGPGPPA